MEGPRHQHLHQEWQEPLEEPGGCPCFECTNARRVGAGGGGGGGGGGASSSSTVAGSYADPGLWAGTTAGRCSCSCAGRRCRRGPTYVLPLPLLRRTPWPPPPLHWFGNPRPTRLCPAAGAGGEVKQRHRAADKQRRRCWHHGCRWRLLLSLSSSAGVCLPSRRRPSTTRRPCSTTCRCPSQRRRQRRRQRLPGPARSPDGIPTASAVRRSAPSSNAPRKERAGLVVSMHSTQRSALGRSIAAEPAVAGERERERGASAGECSNTRAQTRRVDAVVCGVTASAGGRCPSLRV